MGPVPAASETAIQAEVEVAKHHLALGTYHGWVLQPTRRG